MNAPPVNVSFEFFPPKTDEMERKLWETIVRLAPLKPRFVSVTYGAGGSTRERTHATVRRIRYEPHPEGYAYAEDLVRGITKIAPFELSVAAYPEGHPTASSLAADLDNLKRKIDAGATRAITQFFFEPSTYLRFLDRARAAGITVPIVPGVLPVTNFTQVRRIAAACGTAIPPTMVELFEPLDKDPETRNLVAATHAADLCRALFDQGVNEFHFYTLNRADLTIAICHLLGVRPAASAAA